MIRGDIILTEIKGCPQIYNLQSMLTAPLCLQHPSVPARKFAISS